MVLHRGSRGRGKSLGLENPAERTAHLQDTISDQIEMFETNTGHGTQQSHRKRGAQETGQQHASRKGHTGHTDHPGDLEHTGCFIFRDMMPLQFLVIGIMTCLQRASHKQHTITERGYYFQVWVTRMTYQYQSYTTKLKKTSWLFQFLQ